MIAICPLSNKYFLPKLSINLPLKLQATNWQKAIPNIKYCDKVRSFYVIYWYNCFAYRNIAFIPVNWHDAITIKANT